MSRASDAKKETAYNLYKQGMKLVEIASQLNLSEGTIQRWKSTYRWEKKCLDNEMKPSHKKRGGQPGNHNATGPPGNKNAQKFGFFSKYLPVETKEIFDSIEEADPLVLLWHQIQLQYAAILRAQQIMYVNDNEDFTLQESDKEYNINQKRQNKIQHSWDRQANFLNAQSRAMKTLEGLINRYDKILHKDWDMVSDEQKTRIEVLKLQRDNLSNNNRDKPIQITFVKASEHHG